MQLVENEFRTTVSQLKTQSAHLQEQAQISICKLQSDLVEKDRRILSMSQAVRREPSPRDIGSRMQRDKHRANQITVNLDSMIEQADQAVSAGLPMSKRLEKSASAKIALMQQHLMNSSLAIS